MKENNLYAKVIVKNNVLIVSLTEDLEKITKSLSKSLNFKVSPKYKVFKIIIRDIEGNYYLFSRDCELINLNTKNENTAMLWKPKVEQYWDNV